MPGIRRHIKIVLIYLAVIVFISCQQPGRNSTGSEFMGEMYHSIAYEANYYVYYHYNTWGGEEEYYEYAKPRLPVKGTIARGYAGDQPMDSDGDYSSNAIHFTPNGSVPYYYGDTEDERTRAMDEILYNPFPITDRGLDTGKKLYTIYCGICHGDNGDGNGYLAREDGGKFPVVPTNLLLSEFVTASNGRIYHAIMYGRNMMGSYRDKLSYEDRWQVIHYVRSLQAKNEKLEYNQLSNTLNDVDVPAGHEIEEMAANQNSDTESTIHDADQDEDHSEQTSEDHH